MARFILQVLNNKLPEIPGVIEDENESVFESVPRGVLNAEIVQLRLMLAERNKEIVQLKLEAGVG